MFKLKYATQNYAWGHIRNDSEVYNLMYLNDATSVRDDIPYAELWLGTHLSGPSIVELSNQSLEDMINETPEILGQNSIEVFGNKLPFLLKVLSVRTALSIQIHPNKTEAEFLNKHFPEIYKDNNHKPEMAIALTDFEALLAFRPLDEITYFFDAIPQLSDLIGKSRTDFLHYMDEEQKVAALKVCYKKLMMTPPDMVAKATSELASDFYNGKAFQILGHQHEHLAHLYLKLYQEYPNDVGCFCVFLFNKVNLKPGEAIYLGADIPHAYISGTCIECMACSDNVIRAGLTPKFKDVDSLVSMVIYKGYKADELKFTPKSIKTFHNAISYELFSPPIMDFAVEKINVDVTSFPIPLNEQYNTASIFIVIGGEGFMKVEADGKIVNNIKYGRGNAFFVTAYVTVYIQARNKTLLFRAFANVSELADFH